jgi:hypothetical protein
VQINSLPIWIVTRVEGSSIDIELVRKHELHLLRRIPPRRFSVSLFGCIVVYEPIVAPNYWDLSERDIGYACLAEAKVATAPVQTR